MKLMDIGRKISELRTEMNLTQWDLAEGICTQASISLIEKGELDPNATTLYQIAKKLGVDVNYFFHIGSTPRLDYVYEVEKQLRELRIMQKYEDMMRIVKVEEKNPIFYRDHARLQYLYWHKSIYYFEVKKDYEKAVEQLDIAITLVPAVNRAFTEHEIEMIMTRGAFEYNVGHVEEAIDYYKKVSKVLEGTSRILHDKSIKSRYYYNLARAYTNIGKLKESTALLTEGIEWGIENEELYTMAEFHYQIGYNYERMNDYKHALEFLDLSIDLFNLRSENPYKTFLAEKRTRFLQALKISP